MEKKNITDSDKETWDTYLDNENIVITEDVRKSLKDIYNKSISISTNARNWYWLSIKSKKLSSIVVRAFSFVLLIIGVVLPIIAGLSTNANTSLLLTQSGVAILAAAGLLQAGDKVFGWSSGWLRYIATVTEMEAITSKFKLDWAQYIISKNGVLETNDKQSLFELAKIHSSEIMRLQEEETRKWVTEFNQSVALLGDLIQSQRQSAEKAEKAAQTVVKAKEDETQRLHEEEKRKQELGNKGHLVIEINHTGNPKVINIRIDNESHSVEFTGISWIKRDLTSGYHDVYISYGEPTQEMQKLVKIEPGIVNKLQVSI